MKKAVLFCLTLLLVCSSCSEEENLHKLSSSTIEFSNYFFQNIAEIGSSDITSTSVYTRVVGVPFDKDDVKSFDDCDVYINYPAGTDNEVKNLTKYVTTAADIVYLQRHTAARFYNYAMNKTPFKITLSKSKTRESLLPMLEEAKKYLRKQGMTDAEIAEMVEASGGDEIDLITTVIVLVNQDYINNETVAKSEKSIPFDFLSVFAMKAYAAGGDDLVPNIGGDNKIDIGGSKLLKAELFKTAFDCSLQALGVDLLAGLYQSRASKWSLAVIKKVFKSVASKYLGPVGVAITAVSFAMCMHEKRNNYTCEYAIPVPNSMYDFMYNTRIVQK